MATTIQSKDIPMPLVVLNRGMLFSGVLLAIISQQPLIILILFLIVFPAFLFGPKSSLVFLVGQHFLAKQCAKSRREDYNLQAFNNMMATMLLGLSLINFWAGWHLAGWIFAGMVAAASGMALAGFCIGYILYDKVHQIFDKK